ncbi:MULTISPECIES: hypothetical protein [Pseudomonas]|uniref:hypothetical protein n=1 Tax=Pseudomonas TaxID=286 RepID=UPI000E6C8A2B|nr:MULTISPECIES: hypothetical protein [Pseudomonas]MBT0624242.1 hypothetical protein [Pseudomonas fluorescens]
MINATSKRENLINTGKAIVFTLTLVVVICIQFRVQLLNHFSVLYGDSYDATITTVILEHWFNTFRGDSNWSQLYYYFPYTNTLAQTDGHFLIGVIYSVIRLFESDVYLASEWSNLLLRVIGFVAFFLMARKVFTFSFFWSLLAASLFILSNNMTIHGNRIQLATVGFAPVMAMLLFYTYKALEAGNKSNILKYGISAAVFLGAWTLTCFYITWFFIYFCIFFVCIAFYLAPKTTKANIFKQCKSSYKALVIVFLASIISQLPLLSVYLPKAKESGMRPYEVALSNTVPLEGILQVGQGNLLFGELYNKLTTSLSPTYIPNGEYYNTGISPIIFILFIAGALIAIRKRHQLGSSLIWPAMASASLLTWVFILNIKGHSAWFFLYMLFPGAKALQVVSIYQIFLAIPVISLAIWYLSKACKNPPKILMAIIVSLLILEELNHAYVSLVREDELAKSELSTPPPAECSSFYVSGWAKQPNEGDIILNMYAHNITAMLIAEKISLPTINGMASFNPRDWNFAYPNRPDYDQRISQYISNHQLSNVCKLDLESKAWSKTW